MSTHARGIVAAVVLLVVVAAAIVVLVVAAAGVVWTWGSSRVAFGGWWAIVVVLGSCFLHERLRELHRRGQRHAHDAGQACEPPESRPHVPGDGGAFSRSRVLLVRVCRCARVGTCVCLTQRVPVLLCLITIIIIITITITISVIIIIIIIIIIIVIIICCCGCWRSSARTGVQWRVRRCAGAPRDCPGGHGVQDHLALPAQGQPPGARARTHTCTHARTHARTLASHQPRSSAASPAVAAVVVKQQCVTANHSSSFSCPPPPPQECNPRTSPHCTGEHTSGISLTYASGAFVIAANSIHSSVPVVCTARSPHPKTDPSCPLAL